MESQTGAQRLNKIIHFVPFEPGTTDRSKPAEFISTVRGSKIYLHRVQGNYGP